LSLVCTLYRTGNANRCHGYSLYKASTSIPIYIISWLRHNRYHVIPSSSVFWFKDKHIFLYCLHCNHSFISSILCIL
jgi:hypothetical protein